MLKAVITADIINSRKEEPRIWLRTLKKELQTHGKTPQDWEIYRGDSLQLVTTPEKALQTAIQIKATLKLYKSLDVRVAIGIGEITYRAKKITESNGSAFVRSGKKFDSLVKDETLGLKSSWEDFDVTMNLLLKLLAKITNGWSSNQALIVRSYLDNAGMTQKELGAKLKKQQGNISNSLNKAGYDEVQKVLEYYERAVTEKLKGEL